MSAERIRARVFGEEAELYDRRRPGYPGALYDELVELVDPARRALEAGAGTGRATVELARRGVHVVAFEPDERMAALARRATSGHPVQVEERPFEDWDGEAGSFDLVVSAQAWHWIDPERGPALARRALRPRGVLAVWWNHVSDREWPLQEAIDAVYREHAPELVQSIVNKSIHSREGDVMIEGFEPPERRSYEWKQPYDADAYGELLRTHSDHRLLAPERLEPVVLAITDVINREGGGELIYPYRTDLLVARRTAGR